MAKPEMTMLRVIRLVSDKRASCTSWLPRRLAIVDTAGRVIGAMVQSIATTSGEDL
jgi:hypothetical protein